MSAIAALKGYRTQFLYSLHYILSNQDKPYSYRLEGEEDLDVLDEKGQIVYAIQVKNLTKILTLSDLVSEKRTSFLKRFVSIYPNSIPVLASFGIVSEQIKKWKDSPNQTDQKDKALFLKAGITEGQVNNIKSKIKVFEINEDQITDEILDMLKAHQAIDPLPTAENLLYYIQLTAERQQLINAKDIVGMVARMGKYLSERIAFIHQYGIYINPLTKSELSETETENLKEEFYFGISARYEHINAGLDVPRDYFLKQTDEGLDRQNVLVISGASGQGKSTLIYRYAFNKSTGNLIYEVSLQNDPAKTNEAILAISAMMKGLKVPAYFILHVTPNTTDWIMIAREFSNHPYLRLLVSIRKEDLFLAKTKELDFLYTEVELELTEEEAKVIFQRLDERQLIKTHNDFNDAWVSLKSGVPLLEFIHAITQSSSLKAKLEAQVNKLNREEAESSTGQLQLLRTLCLADAYGARVDVSLVREIPNIKLIIDKFEKEYLLKHSNDRKHLIGLHPVRSMLLVEVLFDELLFCKKYDILSCLKIIEQEDVYPFLLNVFHQNIVTADEFIDDLKKVGRNNWTIFGGAAKALLWLGIRDFIDNNISLIHKAQEKVGDAWNLVVDIYHGNVVDLAGIIGMVTGNNPELETFMHDLQQGLSPKTDVYQPMVQLFNKIEMPDTPQNLSEWEGFADTLFWLSQTKNNAADLNLLKENEFIPAFKLLDLQQLSVLMLGMHFYSKIFDNYRSNLSPMFNDRLRKQFQIPHLEISHDVKFDFVIDLSKEDQQSRWHDNTIRIIDLLRNAYPEKAVYRSQGHGHRMESIPSFNDETKKDIPAENLPLTKWVNINSNSIALVDYPERADDWTEFHRRLETWEAEIKEILSAFSRSFQNFKKINKFDALTAVSDQSKYKSLNRLVSPKILVDPLGLPTKNKAERSKQRKDDKDHKEFYFANKYDGYIKSFNDYKFALENFVRQSGQSCFEGARLVVESTPINDHNLHLSYVNLYDAAIKRETFQKQRKQLFKRFSGGKTAISDADLFLTATIWKSYWTTIHANDIKRIQLSEGISGIRNDFQDKLSKSIKAINANEVFKIIYRNNEATGFLPVFTLKVEDPIKSIEAMEACYNLIFDCIVGTEYQSLKYMMLTRYFPKIYFITEISENLFDNKWLSFPLHSFLDTPFGSLPVYRFQAEDIDPETSAKLNLKTWLSIHPGAEMIRKLAEEFERLKLYLGHLVDLKFFNENEDMDEMGNAMIMKHVEEVGNLTTELWNDLLERLTNLAKDFPVDLSNVGDPDELDYWIVLSELMGAMIPKEAELDKAYFDIHSLGGWSNHINSITLKWGIFMLLLQKKVFIGFKSV